MRIRLNQTKIDDAIEHIAWCTQFQDDGYIPIRVMQKGDQGTLVPLVTNWFNNRDPKLEKMLKAFLKKYDSRLLTFLYSPSAFARKKAQAKYAVDSQIAYVDADGARLSLGMPEPTRVVSSSALNQHWFWVLSEAVDANELQSINRALTRLAHGDKGGHSPAKLFRLPGFMNTKYDPPYRVRLKEDTGEIHETKDLLSLVSQTQEVATSGNIELDGLLDQVAAISVQNVWDKYNEYFHVDIRSRIRQKRIIGKFSFGSGPSCITYPGDDRSEIIWAIGCELRRAGASPSETLALLFTTVFWKSREAEGKAEDPERLIQRLYDADIEQQRHELSATNELVVQRPESILNAIDPSIWDNRPVPIRQWVIEDWVPLLKTTILYGDGGTGKTLLMIMLAVACAMGFGFLGQEVTQGRVYAFFGENGDDDTHIALNDVCRHYSISLADLKGKTRIASRASFDNVLMHFVNGEGEHTELFEALLKDVVAFDADLIIIETAADLFGGNENIRSEVRQFVARCCEKLAIAANAAVILCAHPSVSGIRSGDGSSGSTAWNNSARSRLYLHRVLDDNGHEPDPDHRILSRKKSNFARLGEQIEMYWENGVFVLGDDEQKRQAKSKTDAIILVEIENAFEKGTPWSAHHQAGHRYFVNWMVERLRVPRSAAQKQLGRLLTDGEIVEVEYDAHRHKNGLCTPEQAAKLARNKSAK